jgi:hypothetical protein
VSLFGAEKIARRSTPPLGGAKVGSVATKGRFVLLTFGRLVLGAAALWRAVALFRTASPFPWWIVAGACLIFGAGLLWAGVVGVRALCGKGAHQEMLIASTVAEIDQRAPSGLKPLWIALLIIAGIVVAFILYGSFSAT